MPLTPLLQALDDLMQQAAVCFESHKYLDAAELMEYAAMICRGDLPCTSVVAGRFFLLHLVTYILLLGMIDVREYLDERGESPFAHWFRALDDQAAAKVGTALYRMEQGNLSAVKGVGSGVFEFRIDSGPGYRIYFGKDGTTLIILLGGGTKRRQSADITAAMTCWQDYKRRK